MSAVEVVDIVAGQVGTLDVATATVETLSVTTGAVTAIPAGGTVASPLVIDVVSVVVGAVNLPTGTVGTIDVIMGPAGPAGGPGPPGPTGPTGPPGASGSTGETQRSFVIASQVWEFVHNLGVPPFVMLYDSAGTVINGVITVNTGVLTRVEWFYPIAGSMILL